MKAHYWSIFWCLSTLLFAVFNSVHTKTTPPHTAKQDHTIIQHHNISRILSQRRILHQPLFPASSAPPPATDSTPLLSPPPPTDSQVFPNPDQPFFPEVPSSGQTQDQNQPPQAPAANGTAAPIPTATQPLKQTKTVAIAISVGIVTLGMLSALAFFLYRHRTRHPGETQKLVGPNSIQEEPTMPPSNFLYIGTVEPSNTRSSSTNDQNGAANGSPYHKLNTVKRSERYRPSPELQPLPPLRKPPIRNPSPVKSYSSDDDEESHDTAFYTPQCSSVSNEESYYTPVTRYGSRNNSNGLLGSSRSDKNVPAPVPHSKRTSPMSRFSASSPEMKHVIIPSIKQTQPPAPPPAPPLRPPPTQQSKDIAQSSTTKESPGQSLPSPPKRPKFAGPPPPPNMALLQSISSPSPKLTKTTAPPPPPPPPPPLPQAGMVSTLRKVERSGTKSAGVASEVSTKSASCTPVSKVTPGNGITRPVEENNKSASSSERQNGDDKDEGKPKLKPLHWDKVRATSDRATVWDQLKSSSFQLNEDMMETLFGCNSTNPAAKETTRRSVLPPVEHENRVLDPKKSQNIAILLRALNVTRDEVSEALLDGNPEGLGVELLETLVKMAPTKEEEIKLRDYDGDISKLGSAERFLKAILDIPFAFKRVEAMLYRANFDTEVKYLRKSFETLEIASEELKNSRLFLKLLEAVLRTGNRMNVGTNRGDARAFKLDTLLKLVDIKGTDGKTTLLHFVVQEIIRSEGETADATNENFQSKTQSRTKEDDFKKQGLLVVAGLSRDLINVKKAAGMDSDVLSSYVKKLEMGLEKVRHVLQYEKPGMAGKFFKSTKEFLKEADEEIQRIKDDEKKALSLVKEVTEYFHGDAAKEEAHPFRIFMIVRDFLSVLDHVCKDVGRMQERTMVGAARSFRISSTASLPVLNRYNIREARSSDDESSSP